MKTLIIYEYPKAKNDILDWANKKKIKLSANKNRWNLIINKESIEIKPKEFLIDKFTCNKLVLYGSFNKIDLINLKNITIEKEIS